MNLQLLYDRHLHQHCMISSKTGTSIPQRGHHDTSAHVALVPMCAHVRLRSISMLSKRAR